MAYGSSTLTPTFTLSAGRVVLERSYCTEGATDYQVVVEPADGSHVAAIGPRPFVWSHEELSLDALPVLSVLFSDDGGATWYADATRCAVRFGSRIQSHTIVLRDGTLELPENYCTAAATHVSIAWRAAESRTTIDLARVPASAGLELAASLLPIMSVSWSFDGGASRVFEHTRCAETYGSRSTTRTFELRDGTVTFPVNYCTEGATDAIVAR